MLTLECSNECVSLRPLDLTSYEVEMVAPALEMTPEDINAQRTRYLSSTEQVFTRLFTLAAAKDVQRLKCPYADVCIYRQNSLAEILGGK